MTKAGKSRICGWIYYCSMGVIIVVGIFMIAFVIQLRQVEKDVARMNAEPAALVGGR